MGVLDGKVAIVTGAGQGIGEAIARRFANEGARLVLNDVGASPEGSSRDDSRVVAVASDIREGGGEVVTDSGDITDTATGKRLVEAAIDTYEQLDIVVNCAGILRDRMIFNMTDDEWDDVLRVHLRGHFSTCRPAAAYFREQRNPEANYRIINFSSISGLFGSPGQPNYAAAKMGVVGLTYSLAQALQKYGVTANAISPGAATALTSTVPADKRLSRSDAVLAVRTPDNVAPAVVYVASERSRWLTGRTLQVSGYEVGLYSNPGVIRQLNGTSAWEVDELGDLIEGNFMPVADGLPESIFRTLKV